MSLSRQLVILVSVLIMLLFAGSFAISVHGTRDYLEAQLASHAQDAATSLGLSATSHVDAEDRAMVTTMVNAMFHRGDYLSIRFEDLDGVAWIERELPLQVDTVPAWFVNAFPLEAPQRSATTMAGWRQVGRVVVRSHPGLAYRQLWQSARQMLGLFVAAALAVLLVGLVGLRLLLRPLRDVERQAEAICRREFPVVERKPRAVEFRRVVEAMNRLSAKVAGMLDEAERNAAMLHRQAFQDPLTGLANRRRLDDELAHRMAEGDLVEAGGLLLIELNDFRAYNQAHGYVAGDQLLVATAQAILDALGPGAHATAARLGGAGFAVLLYGVDRVRFAADAQALMAAVAALHGARDLPSADVGHLGGAWCSGQSATALLAEADAALHEARGSGPNAWVVARDGDGRSPLRGRSEWRRLLTRALDEGRFELHRQPVLRCTDGGLLHHEVFVRLRDGDAGKTLTAAAFLPVAEAVGLAGDIDRFVVTRVLHGGASGAQPVAVNIGASSLRDPQMLEWIATELAIHPAAARQLILEFPDHVAAAQPERLAAWIERLGGFGVQFSLDHFARGFASFACLRQLQVHWLKVDGSLLRGLEHESDQAPLLRAIVDIGHGLDMHLVAEGIESAAAWEEVRALGFDGGRGYQLGEPASIAN